jgi:hypothetical protein
VAGLPSALAQRLAPEPCDHPDHIPGGRRQERLEGRAREAKVPTPAQIEASRALRETALHSRPQGILCCELRRLLALPRALECLVVGLQPDRELAWGSSRRGARLAGGACATRGPIEPDADNRIARDIMSRPPMDAGMALGTARLLGLSIDDKGLQGIASPFPPLPTVGSKRRTNHIDLMLGLGGDQEVRIDIAAVEHVGPGEEIPIG